MKIAVEIDLDSIHEDQRLEVAQRTKVEALFMRAAHGGFGCKQRGETMVAIGSNMLANDATGELAGFVKVYRRTIPLYAKAGDREWIYGSVMLTGTEKELRIDCPPEGESLD